MAKMENKKSNVNLMGLKIDSILETTQSEKHKDENIDKMEQPQWEYFLTQLHEQKRNRPNRRRVYLIDEDIIECLKSIHIENAPVVNLVNAALRAFIESNKQLIKEKVPIIKVLE